MGVHAQFEEKEYETLMNASLVTAAMRSQTVAGRSGSPLIFSPGQVLEKQLGFDFSLYLDPGSPEYSLIKGVLLMPRTRVRGANGSLPALPPQAGGVNVFLQYKRPELMTGGHRQCVWVGQEFLRFKVFEAVRRNGTIKHEHDQLKALCTLAAHSPSAKVRYACPSVWKRDDLYEQYANGELVEESVFVAPEQLVDRTVPAPVYHDYWTFRQADPSVGKPNPPVGERDAETGEEFLHLLREAAQNQKSVDFLEELGVLTEGLEQAVRSCDEEIGEMRAFERSRDISYPVRRESERVQEHLREGRLGEPAHARWAAEGIKRDCRRAGHDLDDRALDVVSAVLRVSMAARRLRLSWMIASAS